MRNRIKIIISLLLISILAFSAAACDGMGAGGAGGGDAAIDKISGYGHYSLSDPADVTVELVATGKLSRVRIENKEVDSSNYVYSEKLSEFTLKKQAIAGLGSGEYAVYVTFGTKTESFQLFIITRFISTVSDFNYMREDPSGSYMLLNDIDFTGLDFAPICKVEMDGDIEVMTPFSGIFDGNGYSLKNINLFRYEPATDEFGNIEAPPVENPDNYNTGVFQALAQGGIIRNTAFLNTTVICQGLGGGIVGVNSGKIINCYSSVYMSQEGYIENSGGIAGINGGSGSIENCIVKIQSGGGAWSAVRGVAGWNMGEIKNTMAGHYNAPPDGVMPVALEGMWSDYVPGEERVIVSGGSVVGSYVMQMSGLRDSSNFANIFDDNIWLIREGVAPVLRPGCSLKLD